VTGRATDYADDITITSNHIFNNGNGTDTNVGIKIIQYCNSVVVTDNIITNDAALSGDDQDQGLYIGANNTGIVIRNNIISGHTTDVNIQATAGPKIQAESIVALIGDDDAAAGAEWPIFVADAPNGVILLDAELVNSAAIAVHADDHITLSLRDKDSDGTANNIISSVSTDSDTDNQAFAAFDMVSMDGVNNFDSTHKKLAPGDVVSLKKVDAGNGKAITNFMVQLRYMTH